MFIEVGVLSVVLAASSQRCDVGERTLVAESSGARTITVCGSEEPKLLYGQTIEHALASDLALVTDVRHIMVERADDNLLVWIALDNPSKEVREKVFQKQFDLIDGFPEISFDFNLISSRNRSPEEFASSAKLIYSREDR
jgi:hypothetical protein